MSQLVNVNAKIAGQISAAHITGATIIPGTLSTGTGFSPDRVRRVADYLRRKLAMGPVQRPWEGLSPQTQRRWLKMANDILTVASK